MTKRGVAEIAEGEMRAETQAEQYLYAPDQRHSGGWKARLVVGVVSIEYRGTMTPRPRDKGTDFVLESHARPPERSAHCLLPAARLSFD